MDLIYSIIGFILAISILVVIHEFGHFYVDRLFKVKVLKFSIGFGPAYRFWVDKHGTEYLISLIPLGGYIQHSLEESAADVNAGHNLASNSDLKDPNAINNQSAWVRMAILFAGPMFNLLFAWIFYYLVFICGISNNLPIIGNVPKGSIADLAELTSGLQIIKIAELPVNDWNEVNNSLIKQLILNKSMIAIQTYDQPTKAFSNHILKLDPKIINLKNIDFLKHIGLSPLVLMDPHISEVIPNYPAEQAGIRVGDQIISINDVLITENQQVFDYIQNNAMHKINLKISRNNTLLSFDLTPKLINKKEHNSQAVIGIKYKPKPYPMHWVKKTKYGVGMGMYKSLIKTYDNIILSGHSLISIFSGKLSLKNTAGPLAIGYYAGQSIKLGLEHFLNFLGLVSINLGVLNLLPIPWLDGGSIIHCIYEILTGKSAPLKLVHFFKSISLMFLIFIAIFGFINDFNKF